MVYPASSIASLNLMTVEKLIKLDEDNDKVEEKVRTINKKLSFLELYDIYIMPRATSVTLFLSAIVATIFQFFL